MADLAALFDRVPLGWSVVLFRGRRYGVTRTTAVGGRSSTLYAEELGGRNVVSANLYLVSGRPELRPCEMSAATVLAFLDELSPLPDQHDIDQVAAARGDTRQDDTEQTSRLDRA